jgi:16S rRNA (cytosine1402-N4)-methyltransferase
MMPADLHLPVLATEAIELLAPQPGQVYVDGTLGGGGHTRLLAEAVGPRGRVIATDRDPAAIEAAQRNLANLPVRLVHASFCEIPAVLAALDTPSVHGVLLDLGLSSVQLGDPLRGFSFDSPGPLDMRFDPSAGEPAWRLLERCTERELADLIFRYGEERFSRRIAKRIVGRRRTQPIRTAAELAALVRSCVPRSRGHRIDPATRTFQALRIAVNSELEALERALRELPDCLEAGGRFAVISFHSLEDRRVKIAFREDPRLERITRKPVRPGDEELARNPRSRSARLRVAARVAALAALPPKNG